MITIRENVPLAPYTYFKIGGQARFFAEARSKEELREALEFAHTRGVPFWILGGGSNVLIADEGLPGLVILLRIGGIEFTRLNPARPRQNDSVGLAAGGLVRSGAGVSMAQLVAESVKRGFTGFEWAIGIPGTIGGSVRGNAGCFESEIKDVIEHVDVFDVARLSLRATPHSGGAWQSSGKTEGLLRRSLRSLSRNDCTFAYRESIFKRDPSLIILSATLKLKKGNPDESRKLIAHYATERTAKQDIGEQCAGCMFKNFSPEKQAGFLIDTAGCKSMRVGNAMVSLKHANYFINCGGATAEDVLTLAARVKEEVKTFHGIVLQEEIQYLP